MLLPTITATSRYTLVFGLRMALKSSSTSYPTAAGKASSTPLTAAHDGPVLGSVVSPVAMTARRTVGFAALLARSTVRLVTFDSGMAPTPIVGAVAVPPTVIVLSVAVTDPTAAAAHFTPGVE